MHVHLPLFATQEQNAWYAIYAFTPLIIILVVIDARAMLSAPPVGSRWQLRGAITVTTGALRFLYALFGVMLITDVLLLASVPLPDEVVQKLVLFGVPVLWVMILMFWVVVRGLLAGRRAS